MPSTYYADGSIPSLVTPPAGLKALILSSTDATPIVIQTVAPHLFTPGAATDTVEVEGHLINTNANGVWQISVIDATHFSLDGSAGTGGGPGGQTGYAVDWSVNPAITIPSDGDLSQAAAWNPAVESLSNMVPFLNRRIGKYRLYDIYFAQDLGALSSYASLMGVTTTVPAIMTGSPGGADFFGTASDPNSPILSNLSTGDALFVQYAGTVTAVGTAGSPIPAVCLGYAADPPSAYVADVASQQAFATPPPQFQPIHLSAVFFPGGPNERFAIGLMANLATAGGTANIFAQRPFRVTAFHYRPN